MKRSAPMILLLLLMAAFTAGCSLRPGAAPETDGPEALPALAEAETPQSPTPSPGPTPTPEPTPCPHAVWESGVCAACGEVCPHPAWEGGRCAVCGIKCEHPGHDPETRLCPVCGGLVPHNYVEDVCTLCGEKIEFETSNVPRELFDPCERRGHLEILTYTTEAYTPQRAAEPVIAEKNLTVYVPYGYDPAEKYDVLILLHGIRDNQDYWLIQEQEYYPFTLDTVYTADMLDNMMDRGLCRKVIIAAPTFYKDPHHTDQYERKLDEPRFLTELREDILPLLIETYSTWAEDGSPEAITAQRQHFGFAGLSMGSIYGYTSVLPKSLDYFGWFGCFSGADGYMDQLAAELNRSPDADYPIYYFYNSIGTKDMYYYLHRGFYRDLVALTRGLTEGKNAALTEVKKAAHEYCAWSTGLYNFLQIAFADVPGPAAEETTA